MRKLIFATLVAATAMPLAMPAGAAQYRGSNERQEQRECARELRDADTNREYRRERRECAREINEARRQDWRQGRRYDYNRPPAGGAYYADDYYRDGRYYRERRLSYNDRIYQGRDGRYYCRRNDGTTGLIIGAGAGALIGNSLDGGRSSTLGTILGAVAGGAIGREVDRNSSRRDLRCR
jgi:Ni/Co efflux regulator RcnB